MTRSTAGEPLPRGWYARSSPQLARALLGVVVMRDTPGGRRSAIIVETEAYAGPDDRASHARAGRTRRTGPMFGPPGHAYVYLVYGLHHCLNVVAEPDGQAGAVLLRALEPLEGFGVPSADRGSAAASDARLLAGPARLCRALGIDRALDGHDLTLGRELWLAAAGPSLAARIGAAGVVTGPRVGVGYAGEDWAARPWRFGVRGHPSLSRPFPGDAPGRDPDETLMEP